MVSCFSAFEMVRGLGLMFRGSFSYEGHPLGRSHVG